MSGGQIPLFYWEMEGKRERRPLSFILAVLLLTLALLAGGCGGKDSGVVRLAYVEWDTETASAYVVREVLKDAGYKATVTPVDMQVMWQAVASGKADAMAAAWLPTTHRAQYETYRDRLTDLGPCLTGTKIGLVVPSYMKVRSIEDLSDEAGRHITGIEPGAGIMSLTERALLSYPSLKGWTLDAASTGAMVTALRKAMDRKEPIIITGWAPHWMFSAYDLVFLDDPRGVYGGEEEIRTMVRKGFDKDNPGACRILDRFSWTVSDMNEVMLDIAGGMKPEKAARKWIDAHPDKVATWTEGVRKTA